MSFFFRSFPLRSRFFSRSVLFCALFVLLSGCGFYGDQEEERVTPAMEVQVVFLDVHRCSLISPEIQVRNAPSGTTSYKVRLLERIDNRDQLLGEGSWRDDGTGVIPEGALTGHYKGPCPAGEDKTYIYEVKAMSGNNPNPLAVAYQFITLE